MKSSLFLLVQMESAQSAIRAARKSGFAVTALAAAV
jgi:hypothetical protein